MEDDVVAVFALALFGTTLTLGAWFVRGLTRSSVETLWSVHSRATNPAAYWFWAVYHVAGMSFFIFALIAVTLYFVLSVIA